MTEKELHKLHRRELLELLLQQGKEAVQLGNQLSETEDSLSEVQAGNDRLKSKLDDKDAQIEKLKERLNEKDAQIGKLKSRLDEKDAKIHDLKVDVQTLTAQRRLEIGEIITALKLDGFLESIQQAADQYLLGARHAQATIVEGSTPLTIEASEEAAVHMGPETLPALEKAAKELPEENQAEIPEDAAEDLPEEAQEDLSEAFTEASVEEHSEQQHEKEPYEEAAQPQEAPSEAPRQDESEKPAENAEPLETEQKEPEPEFAEKNMIDIEPKHFWQRWRKSRQ